MKRHIRTLACLAALIMVNHHLSAQVIFDADFEGNNFNELQACGSDAVHTDGGSVDIVDNPLQNSDNPSAKVVRYTMQKNSNHKRAENRIYNPGSLGEYWYGWQIYIPADWQPATGRSDIIQQWHRGGNLPQWARGNPMEIHISDDGTYQLKWSYGGDGNRVNTGAALTGVNANNDKGKWVHWAFHVNWKKQSQGGGGFMEVYHNGVKVLDEQGPNWLELDRYPCWKAGIYTGNTDWGGPDTYTIYDDNFILGGANSTINDVNPNLSGGGTGCNDPGTINIGGDSYNVNSLGCDDFSEGNWQNRWQVETTGNGSAAVNNERLELSSSGDGVVVFNTDYNGGEYPQDFLVRFNARCTNAGSLRLIYAATHVRNENNSTYNIGTYDGDDSDYNNNLRKYRTAFDFDDITVRTTPPQFTLFTDNTESVTVNQTYEIVIAVKDGVISYYLDGQKIGSATHDHPNYPNPFDGGKFYVRTNNASVWYDDFEFFEIGGGGSSGQTAYNGPHAIPGAIEAEFFDDGGQGVAYNDDGSRDGNNFRSSEDVDVTDKSNASNGMTVGYTDTDEWLEYTISNVAAGDYDMILHYSSGVSSPGDVEVSLDGAVLGTFTGPVNTGGWNNFSTVTQNVSLSGGSDQVLRLTFLNGGGLDVDYIEFVSTGSVPVTGVTIDNCPSSALSAGGSGVDLDATVAPFNATDQSISWSTKGSGIVSVNSNGVVTPISVGTDTVIVTTNDGGFTDQCPVSVEEVTELLTDDFGDGNLNGWTTVDEGNDGGGSANWGVSGGEANQSSNTYGFGSGSDASSDDRTGTFAYWDDAAAQNWANYELSMDIRSTDDDGIGAMIYYQDASNYYRVDLDDQNNFSKLIKKVNGTVTLLDNASVNYTQNQSHTLLFSVDNGALNVKLDGNTILSATDNDLTSGTVAMYCWANNGAFFDNVEVNGIGQGSEPVTGVAINNCPGSPILEGNTVDLDETISPSNATNQNVSWSSDDTNVATVDANGVVTATGVGTATITVTTEDGQYTDDCDITVDPISVTSVSIDNCPSNDLEVNDDVDLEYTINPSNATDQSVSWSSDNTSVATVDANGLVTAVAAGSATITVITNDGNLTDDCDITVVAGSSCVDGGLLTNNSFENGLTDWGAAQGGSISVVTSPVQCGSQAIELTNRTSDNSMAKQQIEAVLNANGSGDYEVEAWVRTVSGTTTGKVDIIYNDGSTN